MFGTLSIRSRTSSTTFARDYRGFYSQDQFTYREDPARAIERSLINFANLAEGGARARGSGPARPGAPRAPGPTCSTCVACARGWRPACVPPSSSAPILAPTPSAPSSFRARTAARWERPSSTIRAGTTACCCTRGTRTWRARTPLTTSRGCVPPSSARSPGHRATEFARHRVIGIGVDTTDRRRCRSTPRRGRSRWTHVGARTRSARVAVEGPHGRGGGGHHRCCAHARVAPARSDRRHLLIGVVVVEDLALPEGRARCLRCRRQLGGALADFVPAVLAGATEPRQIARCICAAGHKARTAMQGGLPPVEFLETLDPRSVHAARSIALPPGTLRDTSAASGRRRSICRKGFRSRWVRSTRTTQPLAPASGLARSSRSSARRPATAQCCHEGNDVTTFHGFRGSAALCRIDHAGLFRDRSRSAGRRRSPELVGRRGVRGRQRAPYAPISGSHGAARGRIGADRARLEQRQPHDLGRRATDRAHRRADAAHDPRRDLTARSSRLRHSGLARSSIGSASTAWPSIGSSAAAASPRRTTSSCRSTPTCRPADADCRLGADGARSGDPAAVTAGSAAGGYDDWGRAQHSMTTVKDTRFRPAPHDISIGSTSSIVRSTTRLWRHDAAGGRARRRDETAPGDPRGGCRRPRGS